MIHQRRARLFKNGRSQAVRIPKEFEFTEDEVTLHKEGNRLIVEPVPADSLLALLATLEPIEDDFEPIIDLPPDPVEL